MPKTETIQNLICKRNHEGSTEYLVQFNEKNDVQWMSEDELKKHDSFFTAVEELTGLNTNPSSRSRSGSDLPSPIPPNTKKREAV